MKPGDKVICVDDQIHPSIRAIYRAWPVKNEIYTVRWFGMGRDILTGLGSNADTEVNFAEFSVLLVELVNDIDPTTEAGGSSSELLFKAQRFAPLIPPEVEEEMLQKTPPIKRPEPVLLPA